MPAIAIYFTLWTTAGKSSCIHPKTCLGVLCSLDITPLVCYNAIGRNTEIPKGFTYVEQ